MDLDLGKIRTELVEENQIGKINIWYVKRQIIQNLFSNLEIEKTFHGSRHFFTTELIKYYKSDLTTAARFTRHNSLNVLQVYNDEIASEDDPEQLAKAFQYDL